MPMAAPNPFARAGYLLAAHTPRQLPPDGGFDVA
jgi:GTP-binding protein